MVEVRPDEVSAILRQQLAGFKSESELEEVGTVLQVGDGIARVYGLTKVQSGELVEFDGGLQGIVLNLEEDNVGVVLLGQSDEVKEGDTVKRTNKIASIKVGEGMLGRVVDTLGNPIISQSKKIQILADIFSGKVDKLSISFFNIMVNKGRGEVLYATAQEFNNQYNIIKHITKATVVSATALSEANKNKLLDEVKAAVGGGEVILDAKTDPSLIGGFVLTVGDRQVDTSIANSLKKLKKDFAAGIVK